MQGVSYQTQVIQTMFKLTKKHSSLDDQKQIQDKVLEVLSMGMAITQRIFSF